MHSRALFVAAFVALAALAGSGAELIVFGPETFTRTTGSPRTITRTFQIQNHTGSYRLRVVNHGVTSAEITLNGGRILAPGDFNGQVS